MSMKHEKKLIIKTVIITILALILLNVLWHYFTKPKIQAPPSPSVVVQKPQLLPITDYITQTGTVVAYNAVNLVARIEGYLQSIEFTDGTLVKKDKELFVIEPKPYLEKLKGAQASVTVQKASYAYTKAEYARQKRMYTQNATSLNTVEKWAAQTEETYAEIEKATANAEVAAINYSYTHVHAPFDGRIGRHLVDVGNLVGNGKATDLATIQQIAPIYVYFNLNELDLIKVRTAARSHGFKASDLNQIPVYVRMQNESKFLHEGKLDFVNTALNASTGTMEFRAVLTNKDYALLPGLFVQVRIPIGKPTPQLSVPDLAVQYDQISPYLLVVDNDNKVLLKRVELGALEQGMRAISKGLEAKDNVIISGLQNAIPGLPVAIIQSEKK